MQIQIIDCSRDALFLICLFITHHSGYYYSFGGGGFVTWLVYFLFLTFPFPFFSFGCDGLQFPTLLACFFSLNLTLFPKFAGVERRCQEGDLKKKKGSNVVDDAVGIGLMVMSMASR